jgi:hypothetical protein
MPTQERNKYIFFFGPSSAAARGSSVCLGIFRRWHRLRVVACVPDSPVFLVIVGNVVASSGRVTSFFFEGVLTV